MTEVNQSSNHNDTEPKASHEADTEPNEESLRQMTGAPDINSPLIRKDAFADVDISSSRPVWKLPFPKLALIAVALVPVFGFAGYFLAGGRATQQQATLPSTPEDPPEPSETVENTDLQVAEQEIARLKSQVALNDQAYVPEEQGSISPSVENKEQKSESATATPTNEPNKSQAATVAARPTPPAVNYSPPPPTIRASIPTVSNASNPSAIPESFANVDPFEQWRQLAQLGSYGSIGSRDSEGQPETDVTVAGSLSTVINESPLTEGTVPTAYFAATSATVPSSQPVSFHEDTTIEQLLDNTQEESLNKPAAAPAIEGSPKAEEPSILVEAESRILEEQTVGSTGTIQSLVAGGSAAGELITPVVLDNEGAADRFMVVLSEPLTDNASHTAIPAGALLVVKVDRVSENGLVQLSATQVIWEDQGFQRELVLPSQTLLIRGNGGNPLTAESYGDMGGDIASMDMGQFALGAIRRVGELYTRSDSRVQTGDGTTVITESNPAPNILAGVLEGGSDAILDAIGERNQQAIEKLRDRPSVPYVPAGTSIQVFVNQSMQMPSGF
ncbi:MAG: hypothetical protein AAFY54_06270 [Cyanobacteria bacterium J06648_10]